MEIHGCDIILPGAPPAMATTLAAIRAFWPDLVTEAVDDTDLFVYQTAAAKAMWDEGAGADGDCDMIFLLPRAGELTVVIDDHKTLLPIAEAIRGLMAQ